MDRAGVPFVAVSLLLTVVLFVSAGAAWAAPFAFLTVVFAFFFRDPERQVVAGDGQVIAPADGRVLVAGPAVPAVAPPGDWRQVSIFLSPLDVHVNRVPATGEIVRVLRLRGRHLAAYRADAAAANERTEIWLRQGDCQIVFRQVVGVLARRLVCRLTPGQRVAAGQRFGIMKFGSRMDVFVPGTASLQVRVGERVRGGESVLATLAGCVLPSQGSGESPRGER
jgi:phosphatidylserine decarboxylase